MQDWLVGWLMRWEKEKEVGTKTRNSLSLEGVQYSLTSQRELTECMGICILEMFST